MVAGRSQVSRVVIFPRCLKVAVNSAHQASGGTAFCLLFLDRTHSNCILARCSALRNRLTRISYFHAPNQLRHAVQHAAWP